MRITKRFLFGLVLFASVALTSSAYAGNATVVNNGANPMVLNIKVNGARQFPTVQPGETFTVPSGVSKVGFLTEGDVTVTRQDGTTAVYKGQRPPSTTVDGKPATPVLRTGETTIVLPQVNPADFNLGGNLGYEFGAGLGPAASDPPIQYPADPSGLTDEQYDRLLDEIDMAENQAELDAIQKKYGLSDRDMEFALVDSFFDWLEYMSGSGGMFGDCVGTNCQIGINTPGYPSQGAPIGSWTHFVPGRTMIASDSNLISNFSSGGISDENFQSSFENIYGARAHLDY